MQKGLSDQHSDRVFKLRALHGDIRLLHACRLELGLRLGDIGFRRCASLEAIDRKL
jgi:hypothetical protein